jgi:hypothetical protein
MQSTGHSWSHPGFTCMPSITAFTRTPEGVSYDRSWEEAWLPCFLRQRASFLRRAISSASVWVMYRYLRTPWNHWSVPRFLSFDLDLEVGLTAHWGKDVTLVLQVMPLGLGVVPPFTNPLPGTCDCGCSRQKT